MRNWRVWRRLMLVMVLVSMVVWLSAGAPARYPAGAREEPPATEQAATPTTLCGYPVTPFDQVLDRSFGRDGVVEPPEGLGSRGYPSGVSADGRLVAVLTVVPEPTRTTLRLARWTTQGALDPSFGVNGIADLELAFPYFRLYYAITFNPTGAIALAGTYPEKLGEEPVSVILLRIPPDGTRVDVAGLTNRPLSAGFPRALALWPDGGVALLAVETVPSEGIAPFPLVAYRLWTFTPDGQVQAAVALDATGIPFHFALGVAVLAKADGTALVVGTAPSETIDVGTLEELIYRSSDIAMVNLTRSGALVTTFGDGGWARVTRSSPGRRPHDPFSPDWDGHPWRAQTATVLGSGHLLVMGDADGYCLGCPESGISGLPPTVAGFALLDANGRLVSTFGDEGRLVLALPGCSFTSRQVAIATGSSGGVVLWGIGLRPPPGAVGRAITLRALLAIAVDPQATGASVELTITLVPTTLERIEGYQPIDRGVALSWRGTTPEVPTTALYSFSRIRLPLPGGSP